MDMAKTAGWILNPGGMLISEMIQRANTSVDDAAKGGVDDLKKEVAMQEIRAQFELQQAKIAQEMAIAQRISEAETVEIEEFYETSGKAGVGAGVQGQTVSVGASAEGMRVTKRIYTFKGRVAAASGETFTLVKTT